jgi:transcriptional regulator
MHHVSSGADGRGGALPGLPGQYIGGQLRGIVGIEFTVTRIEGKAKLSQNRSDADQRGVIEGLRSDALDGLDGAAAEAVASDMANSLAAS